MRSIHNALVIGGGIAGMSTAIELQKRDVSVTLVERDAAWQAQGAGITMSGAALRAFKAIGVLKEIERLGCCTDGFNVCTSGGDLIARMPTPRIAGAETPGQGGILRPLLGRILADATLAAGVAVKLGQTFTSITHAADKIAVKFTGGTSADFDLVVGADGLFSKVRAAIFPDAPHPKYTGQGSWRAVVPREEGVDSASMFMSRSTKAGLNPISRDEMYLFCLDERPEKEHVPEDQWSSILAGLLKDFSGPIGRVRDGLDSTSRVQYRPLEALLMPPPWHQGRVVLVGDAAHATTPHLASGAAIGVEDAIVLAEELEKSSDVETALQRYVARRFERCRMVVENSLKLGDIERTGGSPAEHGAIMKDSMFALLQPF